MDAPEIERCVREQADAADRLKRGDVGRGGAWMGLEDWLWEEVVLRLEGMAGEVWRVKDWAEIYETHDTRKVRKTLLWIPIRIKQDGDGYTELVQHPDGAAHFGAWVAILQVAAHCKPRGNLVRASGAPHTPESLARMTRLPASVFEAALPRLLSIGWMERSAGGAPARPANPPTSPAVPPASPATDPEADKGPNPWEQFRAAYPECRRNVGVERACRAYVGRIEDAEEHGRLMAGLKRHIDSDQWQRSLAKDHGRFIPTMERFISDGLYNDSPPAYKPEGEGPQYNTSWEPPVRNE